MDLLGHELLDFIQIAYIKLDTRGSRGAMLLHKQIKIFLATTNRDNKAAVLD